MSPVFRWFTTVLLLLPIGLAVAGMTARLPALAIPAVLLAMTYAVVWLAARPTRFELAPGAIEVVFPLWRRTIPAGDGLTARALDFYQIRQEFGLPLRIGVGGLWGAFGWFWTARRGLIEVYMSRMDDLVLVERRQGRPLLLTPEDPAGMIQGIAALSR
jgi:hypothetical protein